MIDFHYSVYCLFREILPNRYRNDNQFGNSSVHDNRQGKLQSQVDDTAALCNTHPNPERKLRACAEKSMFRLFVMNILFRSLRSTKFRAPSYGSVMPRFITKVNEREVEFFAYTLVITRPITFPWDSTLRDS